MRIVLMQIADYVMFNELKQSDGRFLINSSVFEFATKAHRIVFYRSMRTTSLRN